MRSIKDPFWEGFKALNLKVISMRGIILTNDGLVESVKFSFNLGTIIDFFWEGFKALNLKVILMRGIISTNDGLVESDKLSFSLGKWISFWLRYILTTSIWFCIGKLLNG